MATRYDTIQQPVYERGNMKEFEVKTDFSLKFDDNRNPFLVKNGDHLFYDGEHVSYTKQDGSVAEGSTKHLRSAVTIGWIVPLEEKSETPTEPEPVSPPENRKDYSDLKGGNFDKWIANEAKMEVIKEDSQIVKKFAEKESQSQPEKQPLERAGDQIEVKQVADEEGNLIVSSSTTVPRARKHSTEITEGDHYGADSSIPMGVHMKKAGEEKKKESFMVGDTTPRLRDDATKDEIKRAKGIIDAEESQDAKIIGKIKKPSIGVQVVEGVTLKNQTGSQPEMQVKATVGKGGETAVQITAETGQVVKKIGETVQRPEIPTKSAEEIKSSAQEETQSENSDYLSKLPDDWGKKHWTQKEKFIKDLEDVGFIKFIMTVETINAVVNACEKRLEELGQKSSG